MSGRNVKGLMDAIVITDDLDWVWEFARQAVVSSGHQPLRLQSSVNLKSSRRRLDSGLPIVIDWGCRQRSALALIEEISELFPSTDIANRIIVLAANITREDALSFGELGISRVILLRNRDVDLVHANRDFVEHWRACCVKLREVEEGKLTAESQWTMLLKHIDQALDQFWDKQINDDGDDSEGRNSDTTPAASTISDGSLSEAAYEALVARAKVFLDRQDSSTDRSSAKFLDLEASLMVLLGRPDEALQKWILACKKNPNFHRAHLNLSRFLRRSGRFEEALSILTRKHAQNRLSVRLLVEIGDSHLEVNELLKAEHVYTLALERNPVSSAALNGLAQVRFANDELKSCRDLLLKAGNANRAAARLNRLAISLVKSAKFEEALDLYERAQFVLPQQEKGPMLFYNMGLCYWRWGNQSLAAEYLKLALIKDPEYTKAQKVLGRISASAG